MTIILSQAGVASADRSSRRTAPASQHQTPPSWEDLLGRR